MSKKPNFLCSDCGDTFGKWFGKCPSCQAFNTLKEYKETKLSGNRKQSAGVDLTTQDFESQGGKNRTERFSSGLPELDRVLGGGFFPGGLILFGGSPGMGKSTMSLQVFLHSDSVFYFSGEESREQVLSRAKRLQPDSQTDISEHIYNTHSIEDIVQTIVSQAPKLAVVDSIQMVGGENSIFGSLSQIRENAELLLKASKASGTTILVIGHVTKNAEIAGPKVLEHLVDTVLTLDGDRTTELRILRAPKNRFGTTMEVGVFEMRTKGLLTLENPVDFFLDQRQQGSFGSTVGNAREGARNFFLEVQSLVAPTQFAQGRRTALGTDINKIHLLLAVISKYTPFPCEAFDVYVKISGGMRWQDPSLDLALCASILSSRTEIEIPADTVLLGEVGLSGEVRMVPQIEARIMEAEKLGFNRIITPKLKKPLSTKIKIIEVERVTDLVRFLRTMKGR